MTCSALHKAKVSLAGSHPDSEMATCHLSPCRFQQALLCLGQPAADQALKFIQVFGKPLLSLQQTFAPFTPGDGGLAASTGTAAQEGPDCVPDRGLKSMLCLVTRQRWCPRNRFAPGGGFSSSQVPSSSCPVSAGAPHLWERCVPGVPPRDTRGLPVHHILGAKLPQKPHTDLLFPARHHRTAAILSRPPQTPYSACQPQPRHCQHRGQPTRDTLLGTDEFLNELCLSESFHKVQQPFTTSQKVLKILKVKVEVRKPQCIKFFFPLQKPRHSN